MDHDDEFRLAVGRLAQNAVGVELAVAVIYWGLVGVEQRVGRVVLENNINRTIPLIRKVAALRITDPALLKQLEDWLQAVSVAYAPRNTVLHSFWTIGEEGNMLRADLKPLTGAPSERMSASDIEQAIWALGDVVSGVQFNDLAVQLYDALPDSPWALSVVDEVGQPPPISTDGLSDGTVHLVFHRRSAPPQYFTVSHDHPETLRKSIRRD